MEQKKITGFRGCILAISQLYKVDLACCQKALLALQEKEDIKAFFAVLADTTGLVFREVRDNVVFSGQSLPLLIALKDGTYILMVKCDADHVTIWDPLQGKETRSVPIECFRENWSGVGWQIKKRFRWGVFLKQYRLDWLLGVFKRYRIYFYDVLIASFFLQLLGLVVPLFTQVIIDKVIVHQGQITLNVLAMMVFEFAVFQVGMQYLRSYLLSHTTSRVDVILGSWLVKHLFSLPLLYHQNRRVGDTMMKVSSLTTIREFVSGTALFLGLDLFFGIVFIWFMLYYSPKLTGIALLFVPIYALQQYLLTPAYRNKVEKLWAAGADKNAYLVEMINGISTIKSMALEPQFIKRWEAMSAKLAARSYENNLFAVGAGGVANVIQHCSSLLLLWTGGRMVIDNSITIGQLIALQMLAGQMQGPLLRIIGMWMSIQQTMLAAERLADVTKQAPEQYNVVNGVRNPIQGSIDFERVSFRYQPNLPWVVDDITLHIPVGSCVGIVGHSGSGKSTIAKLLQRIYLAEKGTVKIDGIPIYEYDPLWLRRQIGIVLQDSYLFQGSVRDNIAINRPSASFQDVVQAAQIAGAHTFILDLQEGYDTDVGERGERLSGGQRQRIAIARALMNNPRLLIFDEATSALDYPTERAIMANLDKITAGRTVIIIAHRLHLLQRCDCIYVMEQGKIVENGRHDDLLLRDSLYNHLYTMQYKERWGDA